MIIRRRAGGGEGGRQAAFGEVHGGRNERFLRCQLLCSPSTERKCLLTELCSVQGLKATGGGSVSFVGYCSLWKRTERHRTPACRLQGPVSYAVGFPRREPPRNLKLAFSFSPRGGSPSVPDEKEKSTITQTSFLPCALWLCVRVVWVCGNRRVMFVQSWPTEKQELEEQWRSSPHAESPSPRDQGAPREETAVNRK